MTNPLQEKGWAQMKQILDKELPQKKKNFIFPLWFILILMMSCFTGGYFFQKFTSLDENQKYPATNQNKWPKNIVENQQPIASLALQSEYLDNNIKISTNQSENTLISQKRDKENSTNNKSMFKVIPENVSDTHLFGGSESTISSEHATSENQEMNDFTDLYPASIVSLPIPFMNMEHNFTLTPQQNLKKTRSSNSFHNLYVNGGIQDFRLKNYVMGFGYMFEKRYQKFHPFISLGYNFVQYNIAANHDTLAISAFNGDANQAKTEIEISNLHQIELGLGLQYNFYKNYTISGGVAIPYRYKKFQSYENFSEKYTEDLASTPNGNPQNNEVLVKNTYNNYPGTYQTIDIVPFIGLGINLSPEINISVNYRHGLYPIIKVPIANHKNNYENQLGIQFKYIL